MLRLCLLRVDFRPFGNGRSSASSSPVLPQQSIPLALLFFNVGVEVGQLPFIAAVFAVFALTRRILPRIAPPRPA